MSAQTVVPPVALWWRSRAWAGCALRVLLGTTQWPWDLVALPLVALGIVSLLNSASRSNARGILNAGEFLLTTRLLADSALRPRLPLFRSQTGYIRVLGWLGVAAAIWITQLLGRAYFPRYGLDLPCERIPGIETCVRADVRLVPALERLVTVPEGQSLITGAVSDRVTFRIGKFSHPDIAASYQVTDKIVVLTAGAVGSADETAATIGHELTHALQARQGRGGLLGEPGCIDDELEARLAEGRIWLALNQNNVPAPLGDRERELSDLARAAPAGPSAMPAYLRMGIEQECSPTRAVHSAGGRI